MSSLTTLFNVGAEEYVEFNESLGSKAFLEHVWDQETTPLKQGETADSRLRSAGARLSSSDPPCIEFPTISRIKGKGNEYRLTGRWISWQDLQRRHPLAVRDPPDIADFQRRGAKVGAGEKLNPGEWLTEESLSSKAAKHGGSKKETRENDGWIARGSSQSKYAPKPVAASSSPQVERNGVPAATPLLPQSNGFAAPSSSSALLGRFTTPAEDEEEKVGGSSDDVDKPGPKSPKTPARTRPAGLQLDLESTPTHMRPFTLPLVSPSTTRTPLSATHPLPETPLKHTSALPVAQPNSARQALAERRSRPSVPPLSPPSRDAEEEAMRGLGLGLGLTPTRPTAYVGLGAALSPVQQRRMDLPTIPSSNDEGDEGGASSHETVKATSHPPVVAAQRDEAVDEIESMLLRLRKAKSGLASAAGSSASRWASPAATAAPLAAPPEQSAVRDSQDGEQRARKVSGEERPQQQKASAESEVAVNGKAGPAAGEGRKERKTKEKKEKKEKATKGAAPSTSSSTAASTSAAAAAPPPPTPHLSSDDGGWGAPKAALAAQHPPTPTAPRAMRQKPGEAARPDARAKAGKGAAPSAPAAEPSAPVDQPSKLASPPTISAAPRQPTPPPLAEPSPPARPATPPPPPANYAAQPPQTPALPSSATSTSLASPLLASPSPSTPSHRDLDWAADDDDDEDALPDLGDWGVVLPTSGSTSGVGGGSMPDKGATSATASQPQAKAAPARAQPKAPAPAAAAQRELFPAGGPANAKGARGGQARAVSAAQAVQPSSSSASSSEYAAWRRGERASSAKPAALPASSSRELFPSSSLTPANNAAGSPAWPRHQQHAAQAAPSPADGDWKAARTATLAAEEKREKKAVAAAGAKSKGKAATHGAAQAAAKRAQPGATTATAPPAAQGIKIAGVAKAGAAAPPDKAVPPPTAVSPPKGPKADRVASKKGGAGSGKKKETAAAASANGGGDAGSKHRSRV